MNQYPLLPPTAPVNAFGNTPTNNGYMTQENSFMGGGVLRASKESFSGPMFQSVHESMPKPSQEFNTPTAGVEKDESMMIMTEAVSNEICPNMPPLNPKTNFRY